MCVCVCVCVYVRVCGCVGGICFKFNSPTHLSAAAAAAATSLNRPHHTPPPPSSLMLLTFGRPATATPSDKSFGVARIRPLKVEGRGRPLSAFPRLTSCYVFLEQSGLSVRFCSSISRHSNRYDPIHSDKSPRRLRPERTEGHGRPATAPASERRHSPTSVDQVPSHRVYSAGL